MSELRRFSLKLDALIVKALVLLFNSVLLKILRSAGIDFVKKIFFWPSHIFLKVKYFLMKFKINTIATVSPLYRDQSLDPQSKSIAWFQYEWSFGY